MPALCNTGVSQEQHEANTEQHSHVNSDLVMANEAHAQRRESLTQQIARVNDGVLGDDGGDGSNWVWQFRLEARRRRPAGGETAGGEISGRFFRG